MKYFFAIWLVLSNILPVAYAQTNSGFEPYSWNAEIEQKSSDTGEIRFYQHMKNFIDDTGNWHEINTQPSEDEIGFHVVDSPLKVDLPLYADGDFSFVSKSNFDLKTKQFVRPTPISMTKKYSLISPVKGVNLKDGVLYEGAFSSLSADLFVSFDTEEVRSYIRFPVLPSACEKDPTAIIPVPFTMQFSTGTTLQYANKQEIVDKQETITKGFTATESPNAGIFVRPPIMFDSSHNNQQPITINGSAKGDTFFGEKQIPCSFFNKETKFPVFADTTVSFNPDPSTGGTTVDGEVGIYTSSDWATAWAAASGTSATPTDTIAGVSASEVVGDAKHEIKRFFLLFDTSSIPDSAVIDTGALLVKTYSPITVNDPFHNKFSFFGLTTAMPGSNSTLVTSDFSKCGTSLISDRLSQTGVTVASTYYQLNLTSTGGVSNINKTGVSAFCMRHGRDIFNQDPGTDKESYGYFYTADRSGTSDDPILSITYHTAASSSSSSSAGSSGSGSVSVPSSGTGTIATNATGALVIFHSYCTQGNGVICQIYTTTIEITAVHFFVTAFKEMLKYAAYLFTAMICFYVIFVMPSSKWFFRLLTSMRYDRHIE